EALKTKQAKIEFHFIGTSHGPEEFLIKGTNWQFHKIRSGKLRRYFSLKNYWDVVKIIVGVIQSFFLLIRLRPKIIISAGSYVAVPVIWAGWILRVPSLTHQLDLKVGLANKLILKIVKKITVGFWETKEMIGSNKTIVTGNPIRAEILGGDEKNAEQYFNLQSDIKTVLIMGGGTGSEAINKVVIEILPELVKKYQVIHLTGAGKKGSDISNPRYRSFEILGSDMKRAYTAADLIVARAGLSTLSEISALGKASIIIPLPDSPQIQNAHYFDKHQAIKAVNQNRLTNESLLNEISLYLENDQARNQLAANMIKLATPDAAQKIADQVFDLIKP
ncbi:UDP-N-acetylglucosamine--N-acetylmuramyl-(pentapeptide) pyrophosphoryl-undecaprenol N-acetylglucosamine transferase, partial [Patescibacteria group bacterium]|nr:UDP-N-acetylglucosamine--N-acetylmuramyl-(pentapeptide) pyrophosphoryl-undecaprenol N-acetylglucosamine transferase [Patescibacteria group bacterium]